MMKHHYVFVYKEYTRMYGSSCIMSVRYRKGENDTPFVVVSIIVNCVIVYVSTLNKLFKYTQNVF